MDEFAVHRRDLVELGLIAANIRRQDSALDTLADDIFTDSQQNNLDSSALIKELSSIMKGFSEEPQGQFIPGTQEDRNVSILASAIMLEAKLKRGGVLLRSNERIDIFSVTCDLLTSEIRSHCHQALLLSVLFKR